MPKTLARLWVECKRTLTLAQVYSYIVGVSWMGLEWAIRRDDRSCARRSICRQGAKPSFSRTDPTLTICASGARLLGRAMPAGSMPPILLATVPRRSHCGPQPATKAPVLRPVKCAEGPRQNGHLAIASLMVWSRSPVPKKSQQRPWKISRSLEIGSGLLDTNSQPVTEPTTLEAR